MRPLNIYEKPQKIMTENYENITVQLKTANKKFKNGKRNQATDGTSKPRNEKLAH